MLTRKQAELLRFIHERAKESGEAPSFDEMKDALDLRSKSGIHRLITALEERGFIRRLPNRARAIEVIKLPESVAHGIVAGRSRGFTPSVIEGNLGRVRTASEDDGGRPVAGCEPSNRHGHRRKRPGGPGPGGRAAARTLAIGAGRGHRSPTQDGRERFDLLRGGHTPVVWPG